MGGEKFSIALPLTKIVNLFKVKICMQKVLMERSEKPPKLIKLQKCINFSCFFSFFARIFYL